MTIEVGEHKPSDADQRTIPAARTAIELGVTALLTVAIGLLVFLPSLKAIGVPWGRSDMTQYYFSAMERSWWGSAGTTHFGFPSGMDPNVYGEVDAVQNVLAKAISTIAGNPFVGLNVVLLLSFPAVACLAYAAIRLTGLEGPLAVVLATAYTFIPFHLGRGIGHLHLATMFSAVTGVIAALIIGSGRFNQWITYPDRRGRLLRIGVLTLLVLVTAWSGLYYAAYSLILLVAAVVWRVAQGDRWRLPALQSLIPASVVALVGVGMLPVALSRVGDSASAVIGLRDPMDSVALAGNLAVALFPEPYSIIFPNYNDWVWTMFQGPVADESRLMSNFGTSITTACLVVMLVGLIWRSRRAAEGRPLHTPPFTVGPWLVAYLLVAAALFFVPWGLGFLSSYLGTAQVRAWNRLVVDLLLLFILGATSVLATTSWARRLIPSVIVAVLLTPVLVVEMVLPWRWLYQWAADDGVARRDAAIAYADAVNTALPGECGILTLPTVPYPNNGPTLQMDDYDHFLIGLTNPDKAISYGAYRGSPSLKWLEDHSSPTTAQDIADLRFAGFCGIHVDEGGYDDPSTVEAPLEALLGSPVAVGMEGRWKSYSLLRGEPGALPEAGATPN